jgi:hypothetical protein
MTENGSRESPTIYKEGIIMTAFAPATLNRPYQLHFEHRPEFLYVTLRCETSNFAIAKKYWTEILTMQLRRGYERVLIDKDIVNSMPMHDVVLFVTELANMGCHDVKFAIFDRNYDADRCGFEEMVGTNRGLKVRICESFDQARRWLTGPLTLLPFPDNERGINVAA